MGPYRIHLTGASGSGTTTLGRALAARFAIPHHDTDDFYWAPDGAPFSQKRPPEERLRLMEAVFLPRPSWVLSGSLSGWGNALIPRFTAVVFLSVPTEKRLARLRAREAVRCDSQGMPEADVFEFLDWAARYDDPTFDGRSRVMHDAWLERLPCPVLRLDGGRELSALVDEVAERLSQGQMARA